MMREGYNGLALRPLNQRNSALFILAPLCCGKLSVGMLPWLENGGCMACQILFFFFVHMRLTPNNCRMSSLSRCLFSIP